MKTRPTPRLPLPLFAAALLAIALAYSNSFHNGFHFDDFHTVVDNPAIRSLHNIPAFFTDASTFSVLPANRTYRPIVSTTLALDYALARGYTPLWFHLSTFVLYLTLVVLLFAIYRILLDRTQTPRGSRPASSALALVAATWFGLHPAMAETVNYVIQRGDLHCTLGCAAALYLFARYPHLRRTGVYLLPLAVALLSKPPAAVFPILLALYVYFFEAPRQPGAAAAPHPRKAQRLRKIHRMGTFARLRESIVAALPSAALTAALLILQSCMTPSTFQPSILSPTSYRLTQPYVWLRYAAELILPIHLNVDTGLTAFSTLTPRAIAGLLFLAGLILAIVLTARRPTLCPIAFGLLWFAVTQLPTSLYPLSEVENDHRMFFSYPGLILAAVYAAWLLLDRLQLPTAYPVPLAILTLLLLTAYGYGTYQRNAVWHTEESLWRDDIQKSPHNGRGLMIYGLTQMAHGDYPAALDLFTRALAFTPNYPTLEINLGIVNAAIADQADPPNPARAAEAERHFLRAIALAPATDEPHTYYARWLSQHNRASEALAQLHIAIALNPARPLQQQLLTQLNTQLLAHAAPGPTLQPPVRDAAYWINLSLAQYNRALYTQSLQSARRALALDPNSAEAWNNIAASHAALHQWDDAVAASRRAIALKPSFQLARNNLTWSLTQKAARQ